MMKPAVDLYLFLEAFAKVGSKDAIRAVMHSELALWKGGCLAGGDSEYAREFTQELEAALLRLEGAGTVELFLDGERRKLSPSVSYPPQKEKIHRKGIPEHGCYIPAPPYGLGGEE